MSASWRILEGDCRDVLRSLPAGSVHTVVTSPPYYGLRDYGTGEWEGGDPGCEHRPLSIREGRNENRQSMRDGVVATNAGQLRHWAKRQTCETCGATKTDDQLGLEATPEEYVAALVAVFREVWRVMRDDGTVWLNLGDSYNNRAVYRPSSHQRGLGFESDHLATLWREHSANGRTRMSIADGDLKEKDLLGVPWMVAFALRADGWFLRADIIWNKPNPMPESVMDRPTKAHEYVFMLSKSARYYYDADAIAEEATNRAPGNVTHKHAAAYEAGDEFCRTKGGLLAVGARETRNRRSVWTVPTQPYAGAHFATFPPKLIEPCILAGSPERACGECGAPWERVVERSGEATQPGNGKAGVDGWSRNDMGHGRAGMFVSESRTTGWELSCSHGDGSARGVVLDPFCGAGTTGLVAAQHGRDFIGIELSPKYAALGRERVETFVRLGFRSPNGNGHIAPEQDTLWITDPGCGP